MTSAYFVMRLAESLAVSTRIFISHNTSHDEPFAAGLRVLGYGQSGGEHHCSLVCVCESVNASVLVDFTDRMHHAAIVQIILFDDMRTCSINEGREYRARVDFRVSKDSTISVRGSLCCGELQHRCCADMVASCHSRTEPVQVKRLNAVHDIGWQICKCQSTCPRCQAVGGSSIALDSVGVARHVLLTLFLAAELDVLEKEAGVDVIFSPLSDCDL